MSDEQPAESSTTRVTRGAPPEGEDAGFAGLPSGGTGTTVKSGGKLPGGMGAMLGNLRETMESQRGERAFVEFTLTKKLISRDYEPQGYKDAHLTFRIVELTPEEESRAVTNAGQGMKVMAQFNEMVLASISTIGGNPANYDQKTAWLKAIGPRARKQVDRAYNDVNGIEEREGEDILATAKSGRA